MKPIAAAFLALITITSFNGIAQTLWSDSSATFLRGNHYEVGDNSRTVFTFEHAGGYSWGDSFLFIDRLHSDNGDKETYAEIAPRFQISAYKNQFFENIYIATTAEIGDNFTHYLVGLGTSLNLPNFNYFNVNIYHRNNDSAKSNQQVTVTWALPLGPLVYDGFMDYVIAKGDQHSNMNFTSQLKYNLGQHLNLKTKLFVGVEYAFWLNKFGIDGVDEKNLNLLVKYHF
ncbi:Nucleoside-specific outer membrane channel protein Tsx [Colwellia chukchiensis]|uniref:Nucleoside-specific outer membrane channel protein Tsx n=1 Tax=Colwellia chukchiensis TaxID=641665 RepID=A0A1H7J9Y5_9GAMM|nr:outer membrane protein OmpK [Colwellia chukchiensis]SEK71122.1 Nucleoside-specific outer membrane channel protein Tsx [Colwellia chukchiensis]